MYQVLQEFPAILNEQIDNQKELLITSLIEKSGLTRLQTGSFLSLFRFFVSQFQEENLKIAEDSSESWTADLTALGIMEERWASEFTSYMSAVTSKIKSDVLDTRDVQTYQAGVLPSLKSLGTTVELRGIFDQTYRIGSPLEEYSPKLKSVTPIISVRISVDKGDIRDFYFQATPREIDILINSLIAAKTGAGILAQSHDT